MATYVIGDIHGCWRALSTLDQHIRLQDEDQIILLGDLVDRGPNSRAVLDWVVERTLHGSLRAVMGNHEEVMLQARDEPDVFESWLGFGGRETLASYGLAIAFDSLKALPESHLSFIENEMLDYLELDDFVCVHGNANRNLPLTEQPTQPMRWHKFYGEGSLHLSGKTILCGHTAQRGGTPLVTDHTICIDTCAYGGEWLTAFEVESQRYWQANEAGDFREWKGS